MNPENISHLIPDCINSKEPRLSSFNQRERQAIRLYLILRDGNKCAICDEPFKESDRIDIDHIDGIKKNCCHTNLQLAHHKCNCNKNKKGWHKKGVDSLCVYGEITSNSEISANSAELAVKLVYYPAFIEYVMDKFVNQKLSIIDIKDMSHNLFYKTGGSAVTFERYAGNLVGSETPFDIKEVPQGDGKKVKRYLILKPDAELSKIMINKYVR